MTEVSTDLEPIGHAVIWCAKAGDRWQAQPYLWPLPAAQALAQRLVVEFGGEAFIAPIAAPSRVVTVVRWPGPLGPTIQAPEHFVLNGRVIDSQTVINAADEVSTDLEPSP